MRILSIGTDTDACIGAMLREALLYGGRLTRAFELVHCATLTMLSREKKQVLSECPMPNTSSGLGAVAEDSQVKVTCANSASDKSVKRQSVQSF